MIEMIRSGVSATRFGHAFLSPDAGTRCGNARVTRHGPSSELRHKPHLKITARHHVLSPHLYITARHHLSSPRPDTKPGKHPNGNLPGMISISVLARCGAAAAQRETTSSLTRARPEPFMPTAPAAADDRSMTRPAT